MVSSASNCAFCNSADIAHLLSDESCIIPQDVCEAVVQTQGLFFESIAKINRWKVAADALDPNKGRQQAQVLQKFSSLANKKVLEIGSGLGVNIVVWTRQYGALAYGIEPGEIGFTRSLELSHRVLCVNNLQKSRILSAYGEDIPFRNNSFDIVFSTNVLEHTQHPDRVIEEGMRVLKRGGLLQMVFPNYHSFFEGHYAVFNPPVFFKNFLPWYVHKFWGRDPDFARTLNTELNVSWTRNLLNRLKWQTKFEVLSMGQELFRTRMQGGSFGTWAGLYKVKNVVNLAQMMRLNSLTTYLMIALKAWTPIVLTLRKT